MSITVSQLPNGMVVATDPMPHVDTVSLGLWVNVGTRDEPAEVNGIAHLLEHMAFKGTKRRSARDIAELIEDVGGHLNAYTSREQTAYYAKIMAEDAPLAIDILGDILANSVFDETELSRERSVVLQEIGQANDTPDDIIFDLFQARAFSDQPLGRPVLGTTEIVSRLGRQDLVDYFSRHYGPGQMIAVAAGNIAHQEFVERIGEQFSALSSREGRGQETARFTGGTHIEAKDLEQVHLVIGWPGVPANHPDFYAYSLFSTLLGGGMSSRLFQTIREELGLVYSIYSFVAAYRETGLFGVYAGTGADELTTLIPAFGRVLRDASHSLTEIELARARAQLRAGLAMARESTNSRAEALANQLMIFGRPIETAEMNAKLAAVTLADLHRVGQSLLEIGPTIAALGPLGDADLAAELAKSLH